MITFDDVFIEISSYIEQNGLLSSELIDARADFFLLTGKLNETDLSFTNRMNAFLLWFVFDWRSRTRWQTPYELFLESKKKTMPEKNSESLADLKLDHHLHSLFESRKLSDEAAVIRDMVTLKEYKIRKPDFLLGSSKGTYFETRVFNFGGEYQFSNYFIQHPLKVKKAVKKRCKIIRKNREPIKPFLVLLHSYHTKWERYRNININNIYHFDKSIPEAK